MSIAGETMAFNQMYLEAAGPDTSYDDRDNFLNYIDDSTERHPEVIEAWTKIKSPKDYYQL